MTPVYPDFDDTVARPPRPHERVVELGSDIEDTVTWQRPVTRPVEVAPEPATPEPVDPESIVLESVVLESVVGDETIVTPPALVEPPAKAPPPVPGSAIPDVSDNIWSEPIPDKPLPFRIRLDDGTLVPLDQPVYLGRKPSVPRIHPGGIPLLVTLDSPQREVSSTHLELTTVGGAIVASDVKSTNGSIVRIPGAAPHTLLGGESAVVIPGTIIELGDGNSIELLGPENGDAPDQ